MAPPTPHFGPGLFAFFVELSANNNKDWFAANKARYERDVRDPALRFISDFAPRLKEISGSFVADPRPVGGSMFRIFRDTRFSKDKTPYKTQLGIHFRHAATTKDVHAPGFYLGIGADELMAGGGLWQPPPDSLKAVREAILARPDAWGEATASRTMWGEQLKKVPAGYDATHRFADDLRRKDFVASVTLTPADVIAADFLDRYADACRQLAPLQRFLTGAMGLSW